MGFLNAEQGSGGIEHEKEKHSEPIRDTQDNLFSPRKTIGVRRTLHFLLQSETESILFKWSLQIYSLFFGVV
jgi:hypothetical protein